MSKSKPLGYAHVHIDLSKELQPAVVRKQPRQSPGPQTNSQSSLYTRVLDRLKTIYTDKKGTVGRLETPPEPLSTDNPPAHYRTYSELYTDKNPPKSHPIPKSTSHEKPPNRSISVSKTPSVPSKEPNEVPGYVSLYKFSVLERNKLWESRKELKLKVMRQKKEGMGMEECTFEPQLVTRPGPKRRQNMDSPPKTDRLPVQSPQKGATLPMNQLSPYKIRISVTNPTVLLAKLKEKSE